MLKHNLKYFADLFVNYTGAKSGLLSYSHILYSVTHCLRMCEKIFL